MSPGTARTLASISNLPMNSKKHTGVADATAATEYAAYGQLLALATQYIGAASVGGTATAITLTPTPAITSLSTGITAFRFFSESDCGGPTTLAVSGLAAVTLRRADGTEFASGDFSSGREIIAVYNGAHFRTNILPPVEAGASSPDPFDLHDDVTTEAATLDGTERLVVSDEKVGGAPNRWITLTRSVHIGS